MLLIPPKAQPFKSALTGNGISEGYYKWSKCFCEANKRRLVDENMLGGSFEEVPSSQCT